MNGAYISFPFCSRKCTYCNFASGVFDTRLIEPYIEALASEIEAADFPTRPDTLYLGGGTPSLPEPRQWERVFRAFPVSSWREATLEASPGTITPEKAAGWVGLGINRVSLGVQSFVPREAAATGRKHTPEQVADEVALLRRHGIRSINVDLIAGLAHQTEASWQRSLDWVERLAPEHVSVYMLEVDDKSRLGEEIRSGGRRYGALSTPSEDAIADFYLAAVERLGKMSILRYEISNFARPGHESIHNLKYWNMETYLGFGADAHSFDGCSRWANVALPVEYVRRAQGGESVRRETEVIDATRRLEERFLTGLRQTQGLAASPDELALFEGPLRRLTTQGWLENIGDGRLRLTPEGLLFSNNVFEEFLVDVH